MKQALKHFFIPHEGNEYKPHFFREFFIGLLVLALVILFVLSATSSFVIRKTDLGADVLSSVLIDLTNEERLEKNIPPLVKSEVLETAAQMKAEDMASKEYFAHTSPDGLTPWHWFSRAGYKFVYAGENLAIDFTESEDVDRAWRASPKHYANIVNEKFSEIGIATYDGMYQGQQTTYVVQMFGTPVAFASHGVETKDAQDTEVVVPIPEQKPQTVPASPEVKGIATAPTPESVPETLAVQKVETLVEDEKFVMVADPVEVVAANELAEENPAVSEMAPEKYSHWWQRLMVFGPSGLTALYVFLGALVLALLIMMIVIKMNVQHPKNIGYGMMVVILLGVLAYVNHAVFAATTL